MEMTARSATINWADHGRVPATTLPDGSFVVWLTSARWELHRPLPNGGLRVREVELESAPADWRPLLLAAVLWRVRNMLEDADTACRAIAPSGRQD